MMVITPKHVGAVLMLILIPLLKQFFCASVGVKTLIIKMHGTTVKIGTYLILNVFPIQQLNTLH
jgi:hypothetical protein